MTLIKTDTTKIDETYTKNKNDIKICRENLEAFFDTCSKVPNDTKEWFGADSERYFSVVQSESQQYEEFLTTLETFNDDLKILSESLQKSVTYR